MASAEIHPENGWAIETAVLVVLEILVAWQQFLELVAKEVAARAALVELVATKAHPSPHPTNRWTTVQVQTYFRPNPERTHPW